MRAAMIALGGACAIICFFWAGCSTDGGNPTRRDTGVCMAYDFGLDEPEVGDTASDALVDGEASADAAEVDVTDAASETIADSTTDAPEADASADVDAAHDVDGGGEVATSPGMAPKICRTEIDDIVFISCAFTSCHGRTPDGQKGLYIGNDRDWTTSVVNVKSKERPDLLRVKPGDPKNSWLAHKIVGDHCLFSSQCVDGDCGDLMPASDQPLAPADVQKIVEWIRQGADTDPTCGGTK